MFYEHFTLNAKIRSVQSFDLIMLSLPKIQPDHSINMTHASGLEPVVTGTEISLRHYKQRKKILSLTSRQYSSHVNYKSHSLQSITVLAQVLHAFNFGILLKMKLTCLYYNKKV